MSKLIVSANSKEHLNQLLNKNIDGIIISINKLAVNDSFYVDIDEFLKMDFNKKPVFVNLNKLMHNSDLEYLRNVLLKLKDKDVRILFYDMAVYNICKEYNMVDKLVIYQDHLNASSLSNNFYYGLGINYCYITSDITKDELLKIKNNSKIKLMFTVYGYVPIFYSRRYLISSYLEFINEKRNKNNQYSIVSDSNIEYPIEEEDYGTTVYSPKEINLLNYIEELNDIDYIVMRSNKIADDKFNDMVDKFINHEHIDNEYIGFFNTKTIYKVK